MADTPQQQPPSNKIDDYLLINPIATGKTAQIWEVLHEQSGQLYAMKLLLPEAMLDQDAKNDLKHEAKVGEGLEHPNLIRFRGLVMRKTECYILMELFKTPNLKSWIRNDPVGLHSRFRKMAEGVCMALSHMHGKGWIHKDIKPENILLNRMGEVRVIDFSLAVRKASALSSLMGGGGKSTIQGTRTYLAPETIRKEPSTVATDIYSLGVTFFECLTGQPPFAGTTPQDLLHKHIAMPPSVPSTLNSNISPEMDALILKMLAKKPKDRPQSCDELLAEIRKIQPFKEEVVEGQPAQKDSTVEGGLEAELDRLMVNRRDSRADAQVQALLRKHPELHQMFLEKKAQQKAREEAERAERERRAGVLRKELDEKAAPKAAPEGKPKKSPKPPTIVNAPPAAYPPGIAWPQQPMPGYPMPVAGMPYGMPQPGMAWPQQPMPGAPMPGMPWPGQYMPPGMPPQAMPGYPPQPGMGYPPGQIPPQGMPQPPVPPVAAPPQPARPSPARRPTPPPPAQQGADLPLMTDLPDVE